MTRLRVLLLSAGLLCAPQAGADTLPPLRFLPVSYSVAAGALTTLSVPDGVFSDEVDETPVPDLWQRLRDGMSLPEMDGPLVQSNERWFASHHAYMATTLGRARLYLFHIVDELDKRHMPMELALLPIIESSYNPQAESPSAASGIWQFVPSTGRLFGLKQNGWYDGRRDVINATHAALDYLQQLHDMFGDWELAIAAYNCGDGCVSRAIARNRARGLGTDFSSLDLPPETRNYVPRLIAIRNVIRDPAAHGLSLNSIPDAPTFEKVTLHYPIEARTAAKLADMDLADFLALNPGFRHDVIYATSQQTLLLPPDKVDAFRANLASTEATKIRLHSYHAPKGALLSKLSDRFDVSVAWLKTHNPMLIRHGKLAKAQTLMLPPTVSESALTVKPVVLTERARRVSRHKGRRGHIHTVRKGDTLYNLARRYKVKVADIVQANGTLKTLYPGEKIEIPATDS